MSRTPRPLLAVAVLAVGIVLWGPSAAAQQQLGAIQGTITDQTGGVLPGVSVTLKNLATGVTLSTASNETGIYRMPSLDPGRYEVTAELMGFNRMVERNVTISVGATVGLDFKLQPGNISETVEVKGFSPDIQTEKADVSSVVEERKVNDLPLVGRNPLSLARLQPGITGVPGSTDFLSAEQGIGGNASGIRESGNSATVDGMSINGGPWGGTVLIVPNVEAVQEFQVISNNPSAEFGRNAGAAISIITKAGTNEFQGSAFNFHRNKSLRAKGIFEQAKPDFNRNDFGASLGGPIRRDGTFFFGSYEGVRELSGQGALYTVETQELVNWTLANRPNSIAAQLFQNYRPPQYPTSGLRDLGSPMPGANTIGPPDGIPDVGQISLALMNHRNGDQVNGRVDHVFGPSDRLRASYYLSNISSEYLYVRPQFNHPYPFRNQLFTAGYTKVISNQTLNELSFGWVRQHGEADDVTPESPTISITQVNAGFGVEFWHPISFTQDAFQFKETLTMNRGNHGLRFGGELRLAIDSGEFHHWERPNYTFTNILNFVDDEPFSELRAVDPNTGQSTYAPSEYHNREFALFFQDNWKVRSNVTLNAGLRYENFGSPTKTTPFNVLVLGPGATRQEQVANARVAAADKIFENDWNNFAPRVGLSWDPTGDARWVIRGGAGISYNRINNTNWTDERLNPPLFASASGSIQDGTPIVYSLGPNYPINPALGRGVDANGGIIGARVNLRVIDPDVTVPYIYNWFAGVQHQLPWMFVADVNYVGSAGRNLMSNDGPGGVDYNRFSGDLLDGRLNRLNPSFGTVGVAENLVDSSYHGMTLQLRRRFDRGLAFQAAYTLGKAEDLPGNFTEVTNPELDRGPADFDVRQKLALNIIWEIPFRPTNPVLRYTLGGWQVNAITILQSGSPFSVTCGLPYPQCDWNADGQTGERPNAPAFGSGLGSPDQSRWLAGVFSASDFPLPAAGSAGTLGRNAYRGPGYVNTDLSFIKNVPVPMLGSRDANIQLRLEAFNVFNTAHLANPVSAINSTLFGRVTTLRGGTLPRSIQLGAKFVF
jgi:hypothetical protein